MLSIKKKNFIQLQTADEIETETTLVDDRFI